MYLLLSALPVLAVIAGLLLGLRSLFAALLGVVLALAGCVLAFPLTAQAALQAVTGWTPVLVEVLLIVGGGLLLSEVLRAAGAQKALAQWVMGRTGEGVGAVLLVVHGVTPFAESLTGFGIGITIGIPLLAHSGLPARKIAVIGLLGLCAVPWGSMGPGTLIAATMSGLSFDALGVASAWISVVPMVVVGVAAAWLASDSGRRGAAMLQGALSGLLLAASIGLGNMLAGTSAAGALGALVMTVLWLWLGRLGAGSSIQAAAPLNALGWRALAAYGLLLLGVLVAGVAVRAMQWSGAWHLLASPAVWLFVAAAWFAKGLPATSSVQRVWHSWRQVAPVTGLFIVLGVVMAVSGMAAQLAHALAQGGSAYVFAAPFVGALGGFVTGSNTGANAMFAATQAEIAQALGVAVLPFMAVHNVSAALLLMASPGKVEMACQLVPGGAPGEAQAQRPWVQSTVLLITMAAVLLMAVLNVVLSMALP
ncbi:lactate permease [Comamonas odontotermitis]|uniref:L-lactate permease n=1 Tax=Comamonas odontotermitis TaxID=379895 RepID=A0ABR6RCZ8_9BURK|nr:L-lactate permease [Comamonas odontotermitis]MBB6577022.1 lactate permease [Comamonas odontotermitis]